MKEFSKKAIVLLSAVTLMGVAATGCASAPPANSDVGSGVNSEVSDSSGLPEGASSILTDDNFVPEKVEDISLRIDADKMSGEFTDEMQAEFEGFVATVGDGLNRDESDETSELSSKEELTGYRMLDVTMQDDFNGIILAVYKTKVTTGQEVFGKMYLINIQVNRVDADSAWSIVEGYTNADVRDEMYGIKRDEDGSIKVFVEDSNLVETDSSLDVEEADSGESVSDTPENSTDEK